MIRRLIIEAILFAFPFIAYFGGRALARRLKPGNRLAGPAVIESPDTTYVVAPGWTFHIDAWRNGVLERSA